MTDGCEAPLGTASLGRTRRVVHTGNRAMVQACYDVSRKGRPTSRTIYLVGTSRHQCTIVAEYLWVARMLALL
jgi:hypothetical protein